MRAVAYIRVSSVSQVEGYSLSAQERLFHEYCKGKGWEAGTVYREEGRSAHHEAIGKRPVLKMLLDDAAKRDFDAVVVHTLDRWSRNLKATLDSLSVLGKHDVALVSITENIDYSTPQGKLFTQLLGSFAQYYSDALATHVSKGLDQRAREGLHTGAIPFGYGPCWVGEKGQRQQQCDPEHPGAVHILPEEGSAVAELFKRYATGMTTLAELAGWLNAQGFRTRNTHKTVDAKGDLVAGPRLFTTASVRVILHNAFYTKLAKGKRQPMSVDELHGAADEGPRPDEPTPAWNLQSMQWEHVDERLKEAIERLRPEYRTVLLLWGVEGLKYREIAEIEDIPIGTVMSRLHRARSILSNQLADLAEETGRPGG